MKLLLYILTDDKTGIYSYDPETKRHSTDTAPTKCRRVRNMQTQIIASFFCKIGFFQLWYQMIKIPLSLNIGT